MIRYEGLTRLRRYVVSNLWPIVRCAPIYAHLIEPNLPCSALPSSLAAGSMLWETESVSSLFEASALCAPQDQTTGVTLMAKACRCPLRNLLLEMFPTSQPQARRAELSRNFLRPLAECLEKHVHLDAGVAKAPTGVSLAEFK
jgi:hypothetical protein